eukprot:5055974-Pleurochrysis_carterae.AAC.3
MAHESRAQSRLMSRAFRLFARLLERTSGRAGSHRAPGVDRVDEGVVRPLSARKIAVCRSSRLTVCRSIRLTLDSAE